MKFSRNQKPGRSTINTERRGYSKEGAPDQNTFKDLLILAVYTRITHFNVSLGFDKFPDFGMNFGGGGSGFGFKGGFSDFTFERAEEIFNNFFNMEGGMSQGMGCFDDDMSG